jgi:hypothetical protein
MNNKFFPEKLPEYDDSKFFPETIPEIEYEEPEHWTKHLVFSPKPFFDPEKATPEKEMTLDDVTRFGQRAVKSFGESSALMQLAGALRERFPDVPADPYSKVLQEAIEKVAPETLPVWEEMAREEGEKAQENITESPASTSDVIADTIGSIGGTLFDYATISKILGPLLGKVPAAVKPGVTLGATGLAREGIKDIAGEDKTFKDYARAGVGGFVGGQAGKYLGEGIRYLLADKAISGNVYPFIERGLTGAGVGAAMTGIDYAFGEETTVRDLGLNMASMALMYTIPMLSPKNREGINQARQAALEAQNLSKAFKKFGLKPGASKEELTQRYRSLAKTIHPDVGGSEEQFLKVNQAYHIAMEYINNSSLDPEVKTQAKNNLKDIFTKVKNHFAKPEAGLVEVERPVTQGATPAITPVTYTRKPEVVPKSLPGGMPEEVTIGADITETQPIPETMEPETAIPETMEVSGEVEPAIDESVVETEKFGKLKILDDSDPSLVKAQNEQGTVFKIGKKALREQVKISTPEDIAKAFGEIEEVLESRIDPDTIKIDSDGDNYIETEIDDKKINMVVNSMANQPETPPYIEYGPSALEMPELVKIAKALNKGKYPNIVKNFKDIRKEGHLVVKDGTIEIRSDIFKGPVIKTYILDTKTKNAVLARLKNKYQGDDYHIEVFYDGEKEYARVYRIDPDYALTVVGHEIGHLIDWLPDKEFKGLSLIKEYMKETVNDPLLGAHGKSLITNELKALTMYWKPFNPARDPEYTEYRYSSPELFADAVSVFFNDPELLKKKAPYFYDAFMRYIDRKPEFKAVYEEVLANRKINKAMARELSAPKSAGYQEAIDKRLEQFRKNINEPEKTIDVLARSLQSRRHDLYKIIDDYIRDEEVAERAKYAVKELDYISAEVEDYTYWQKNVIVSAQEKGISLDDLGKYAQAMRILTDRKLMANPEGETVKDAWRAIELLKEELSPEQFEHLKRTIENFIDIRQERVVDRLIAQKYVDEDLATHMKKNRYYFHFEVIEHMEELSAKILPQYGTFKPIGNPVLETLLFDIQLLASTSYNEAKRDVVLALEKLFPESVQKANKTWSEVEKRMVVVPPEDPKMDTIMFMIDGELASYYIPKDIVKTFEKAPVIAFKAKEIIDKLTETSANFMVTRNIAWASANLIKDFNSTFIKNPEIKAWDIPKLVAKYIPAWRRAWKEIMKEETRMPETSVMKRYKMIPPDRIYQPKDIPIENEIEGIIMQLFLDLGIIQPPEEKNKVIKALKTVVKPLKKAYDWSGDYGQISEQTSKKAGYDILTKKMGIDREQLEESIVYKLRGEDTPVPDVEELVKKAEEKDINDEIYEWVRFLREEFDDMAIKRLGNRIRERVGTPNYRERGDWYWVTNTIAIFSNVNTQDIPSTIDAFKDDPAAFLWKLILTSGIFKMAQWVLENASKFFPNSERARYISSIYDGVSPYYKENYIVIPIAKIGNKSIVITIPQVGISQVFSRLLYNSANKDLEGIPRTVWDAIPWTNVNPWIKGMLDFWHYIQGENIYDYWRGREVLSKEAMTRGGTKKLGEFLLYEFSQLGGSAVVSYNVKYADSTLEALLNIYPFNAIGKILRITDAGHADEINQIYKMRDELKVLIDRHKEQKLRREPTTLTDKEFEEIYSKYSELNKLTTFISLQNKYIKSIQGDKEKTEEEKKKKIMEAELEITNKVREYLDKPPLKE